MVCPVCAVENPETASECGKCHTPLPISKSLETLNEAGTSADWSVAVAPPTGAPASDDLQPGTVLAGRYEILQLLGRGGMGAVYKARDTELDRTVAIKLIRGELARNPEILRRFKQELILARQVTHKNVIRIYDLGQADGIKFITMDFVEGRDLRSSLAEIGKFPPEQAAKLMLQICRALEAAHSEGVIHRDLKPQNIMLDAKGRVYVMDFGIARSAYLPGMTQTGALIGTPEYMSPEQARGEKLTEHSDLFSLGVIFYELLTGQSPYPGEAPLATLWKRLQEKPKPPIEIDPTVPKALNDIVMKALEIEPDKRWASAREMAQQLEIFLGPSAGSSTIFLPAPRTAYWKWASAAVALSLLLSAIAFRIYTRKPKAPHPAVSVLVADFTNHTGDPIFEDTLEPMVNVALEGASFINAYSRGNARRLAQKLPTPTDKLDEQSARLVAVEQGLGAVITGSLSRRGDGYKFSLEALDARTGNSLASTEFNARTKDDLLLGVPKLVAPIRKALGDTTPESVQLAASGPFTAASLEVVHQYSIAMDQQFGGKLEDALRSFTKALELDPKFARAYAGMAATYGNLGQREDSEKYIKLAMEHVDRMTERERYRIRGQYYFRTGNWQGCISEYTEYLKQYPSDNVGQELLAICFARSHNMPRATEEAQRAVQIAPKDLFARMNLSLYACYSGDFQTCDREGREAQKLNPSLEECYLVLAYAQLGQGKVPQAAEIYHNLQKVSERGAFLAASGLANLALYEGKYREAQQILEKNVVADLSAKKPDRAADHFVMLSFAELQRGEKQPALTAAEKALANSQSTKINFLAARTFVAAGETAKARKLSVTLSSEVRPEQQAYAKLIEGEAAMQEKDLPKAIQAFTDANKLYESWVGWFDLGRAYLESGNFVEADSEFDRCIKRRGEALEFFDDGMPTYSYLPAVYYYQGRVLEGLKSAGFADSYRTYLSIRAQANEDPLLPEIRRRLGQ